MLDGKNQWTTYLLHEAPVQRGQLISSCWDYPFEQMQFSIQFKKKKNPFKFFCFLPSFGVLFPRNFWTVN